MSNRQHHTQLCAEDNLGKFVLITGDPGRVPKIATRYLRRPRSVAQNREYTTWVGFYGRTLVTVISGGIGCPSTAIAVQELTNTGADIHTIIRVGTAGSLQERVENGHIVITMGSVREEGTTQKIVPLAFPAVADPLVVLALMKAAAARGFRYHVGITHCKDTFFAEGDEAIIPLREDNERMWRVWQKADVLATSMEFPAICIPGYINGIRTGEVLLIVGSTIKKELIVEGYDTEPAIITGLEAIRLLAAMHRRRDAAADKKRNA